MPSRRIDERLRYFLWHGRMPSKYRVLGIFPSGTVVVVKHGFHRHREAHNHALSLHGRLHGRYGVELVAAVERS